MGGARMSLFDINPDREEAFLYKAVSSVCSDYLYIWDLEEDILLASPNMVSDLGLDGNRMTNCFHSGIKWIHPHDRERVGNCIGHRSDEDSQNLEYQALTADGNYIG
ncbi:MAG: hypothetical protein ACLUOI_14295 [Eisenbergiella sp.]